MGEGLQAGCHVVTYGLPAIEDAYRVQDGNPVFVEPGNYVAFADVVLRCLEQPRPARLPAEPPDLWRTIAASDVGSILRAGDGPCI